MAAFGLVHIFVCYLSYVLFHCGSVLYHIVMAKSGFYTILRCCY